MGDQCTRTVQRKLSVGNFESLPFDRLCNSVALYSNAYQLLVTLESRGVAVMLIVCRAM